jgi:hypothetical protein
VCVWGGGGAFCGLKNEIRFIMKFMYLTIQFLFPYFMSGSIFIYFVGKQIAPGSEN